LKKTTAQSLGSRGEKALENDSSYRFILAVAINFLNTLLDKSYQIRDQEREHDLAFASLDLQSVFPDLSSFCATPLSCSSLAETEKRV